MKKSFLPAENRDVLEIVRTLTASFHNVIGIKNTCIPFSAAATMGRVLHSFKIARLIRSRTTGRGQSRDGTPPAALVGGAWRSSAKPYSHAASGSRMS